MQNNNRKSGFTLIELSIVLVIIGLIIGGVLVGQDLINAATIRAQISQIEKYNTAVRAFELKYGYLPGDMPATAANAYGFWAGDGAVGCNGASRGTRDGNGLIELIVNAVEYSDGQNEPSLFWDDLGNNALSFCGAGGLFNELCKLS